MNFVLFSTLSPRYHQRMKIPRRSFLKTVAVSAIPAAALHDLVAQAASAAPSTAELHLVGAGKDRFGEDRHTQFSTMAFKIDPAETGGGLFILEHTHLVPGGPPLHLHLNQEEWFYVEEGEVAFQVGEQRLQLRAGESILAPRRVPHTFSAVGKPGRMIVAFTPAGKMEQFFRAVLAKPELMSDHEFNQQCELEIIGPSPFWKPGPAA